MASHPYEFPTVRSVYITNIFVFAASAYRSHSSGLFTWKVVSKTIPWVISGVIFGYILGNELGDKHIAYIIGLIALILSIKTVLELMGVTEIRFETDAEIKEHEKLESKKEVDIFENSDDEKINDDRTGQQLNMFFIKQIAYKKHWRKG